MKRALAEVMRLEARESKRQDAPQKTEAARKEAEADRDEQEWLREALRMEEGDPNPTSTPPPDLPAKMPTGEEPWWMMKEGKEKEDDGSSLEIDTQDDEGAKSNLAGAKSLIEPTYKPTCPRCRTVSSHYMCQVTSPTSSRSSPPTSPAPRPSLAPPNTNLR